MEDPDREEQLMRTSHKLLLRLRYDPAYDFSQVTLAYVSRGAAGNLATVHGPDIIRLSAEYFEVSRPEEPVCIPYHRIRTILYQGKIFWRR